MKRNKFKIFSALLFVFILLIISCEKQDESNDNKSDYSWSEGLYFDGVIGGEKVYLSDSTINTIASHGYTNFDWQKDSILRLYGNAFDFNNGFTFDLYFGIVSAKTDFDTITGCYINFENLISNGKQRFLYDTHFKPLYTYGFYAHYYKRDDMSVYYLPKENDFQDGIDFSFYITNIKYEIDTVYSKIKQNTCCIF